MVAPLPVLLMRAEAEVQPEDVCPGLERLAYHIWRSASRAERGHELGFAVTVHNANDNHRSSLKGRFGNYPIG